LLSIIVIGLAWLILPFPAAPLARQAVAQSTPRPTVPPPPRPTATPTATATPLPLSTSLPEPPLVPEASSLLLLGSAASGLAVYIGWQLRARCRH